MSTFRTIAGGLLGVTLIGTTVFAQTNQNRTNPEAGAAAARAASQSEAAEASSGSLTANQLATVRRWLQQGGRLDPAIQQALIDDAMLGGFLTASQFEDLQGLMQGGQPLTADHLSQLRQMVQGSGMFDPTVQAMRRWVQDGGLLTADQQSQFLAAMESGGMLNETQQAELANWLQDNGMLDPTQMDQVREWLNDSQFGQHRNDNRTDNRADRRAERRQDFIDRALADGLLTTAQERQLQEWTANNGTLDRDQFQQLRDWVNDGEQRTADRADRRANRLDNAASNAADSSRPGRTSPRERAARQGSEQQARELLSPRTNPNPADRANQPDLQPGDANGVTRNESTADILGPGFNPPVTDTPPGGAVGIRTSPANPDGSVQRQNGRSQTGVTQNQNGLTQDDQVDTQALDDDFASDNQELMQDRADRQAEFVCQALDDGSLSRQQQDQLQDWMNETGTLNRDQFRQLRDWVRDSEQDRFGRNQDRDRQNRGDRNGFDRRNPRIANDNPTGASAPAASMAGRTSPREQAARSGSVRQAQRLLSPQQNPGPQNRAGSGQQPDLQPGDANGITRNDQTAAIAGPAFANPPVTDNPPGGSVGIRQEPANPNGTPIAQGQFGNRNGGNGSNRGNSTAATSGARGQSRQGQTQGAQAGQQSQGQASQGQSQEGATGDMGGFAGPIYDTGASAAFQDPYGYSAMGDLLKGEAGVIRSKGEWNLNTAAAASTNEDARSKYFDNATKHVATYFERKAIHDSYVHPDEPRSLKQYKNESLERLKAESEMAKKLNRRQFDPAMATVYWPGVLQGEEFADNREEIADLMAKRSPEDSGLGSENYRQVRQATEEMHAELQEQVLEIPSDEYMVAKKFIDGIKHEARMVADNPQVAQHD